MHTIDTIQIGDDASFSKTVTKGDTGLYAGISGNFNPAHVDKERVKEGVFGRRIAHRILPSGCISNDLGKQRPRPDTIWARSCVLSSRVTWW